MQHCRLVVTSGYEMAAGTVMKLVTLSGHIIIMADPCMAGVKMKIKRFDIIMGRMLVVYEIQIGNNVLLFPDCSWCIRLLSMMVYL